MRILFLQKRLLFPCNTGGKIRTLNIVRHLARWHEISFVCGLLPEEQPYLAQMQQLGVRLVTVDWNEPPRHSTRFYAGLAANLLSRYPYSVNKDFDPRILNRVADLLREEDFNLVVCDFVQMARNVPANCRVPTLLFQHNVEAQVYRRMADGEPRSLARWFIRNQQHKMERFERRAGRRFDRVVAVSRCDQEQFAAHYGWNHVDVIDTAVDTDFFQPQPIVPLPGRLVFVGSMDWLPNQEGVRRFVKTILPQIRRRHPHVTLDVVGRKPPAAIQRLAEHPGVTVSGSVDDVRPYIAQAEVAVVPLYAGGGTRLKIFEFMAMGVPVVSTSLGAEGLNIGHRRHCLCADSDAAFADSVSQLLESKTLRHELAAAARALVLTHYGCEDVARQFERSCQTAIQRFAPLPFDELKRPAHEATTAP